MEQVIEWLLALGLVWAAWSAGVSTTFEKVVKPILNKIVEWGGAQFYPVKPVLVVVGVFVAGFLTAQEGGYNIFVNAPESVVALIPNADLQVVLSGLFLAVGAFAYHDVPQAIAFRQQVKYMWEGELENELVKGVSIADIAADIASIAKLLAHQKP